MSDRPPSAAASPILTVENVAKTFTMHLRGGVLLPVVEAASFTVSPGECIVLGGPSGVGKSSILRMVFGNYSVDAGKILIVDPASGDAIDLASAEPRRVIELRRDVIGYVSQFLRAIPRVPAVDVVAEPLISRGTAVGEARKAAADLLGRLNLPRALWELPPATFSGGEKQRVNIARGFLTDHPLLLLDEPTASLDERNRDVVCEMIEEKQRSGTAILGIFHDEVVRRRIATRIVDVSGFSARKAA